MSDKNISVIIPMFNHELYILDSIKSILQQTLPPEEIIIIDDGSSDDSLELVKKKYGNDSRFVIVYQSNSGAHNAINEGIRRAKNPYISILNSDDIYEPDRLKICLELFKTSPNAQVVSTGISFINGDGKNIVNEWYLRAFEYFSGSKNLGLSLINGNFLMTTSNFVIRRSAFDKYGYFANFRYAHDLSFILRILAKGGELAFDSRPLLKYRIHSSNTIKEGALKVKVEVAAVIAEYLIQMFHSFNGKIPDEFMRELYVVLDEHNLARMLFPFMAAISSQMDSNVGVDEILSQPQFSRIMLEISK
jgi:glycosyltransferase involved in cell wall biosynthesis